MARPVSSSREAHRASSDRVEGTHRGRGGVGRGRVGGRRRRGSATRVDHVRQLGATAVARTTDGRLGARRRRRRVGGRGRLVSGRRRGGLVIPPSALQASNRSLVSVGITAACRIHICELPSLEACGVRWKMCAPPGQPGRARHTSQWRPARTPAHIPTHSSVVHEVSGCRELQQHQCN
jgi:hypothetical protein